MAAVGVGLYGFGCSGANRCCTKIVLRQLQGFSPSSADRCHRRGAYAKF